MPEDPATADRPSASLEARSAAEGWLRFLPRTPGRIVLLLAFVQVLLWGALCARFDPAPPTDSLEQILFSQDLRIFYVKHPALPTWILYAVNRTIGSSIASTFVLGALCAAVTLPMLYIWARPLVGAARAAVVTLLTSTIVFMNAGAIQYNNNTVQLPFAMASIVLFHTAVARGGLAAWALLGAAAGLLALAKLSAVVLFASFAIYLLWTGRLRDRETLHGTAVAVLVFVALVAPPLVAANNMDPEADQYIRMMIFPPEVTRVRRLLSVWDFSWAQVAAVAPAVLAFAFVRRGTPSAPPANAGPVALGPFLTIVGFGPFVLTVAIAIVTNARLLSGWGTTFHVLLPFWLVAATGLSIDASRRTLERAAIACFGLNALLWIALVANGGALPNLYGKAHRHHSLAPRELAAAVRRVWEAHTSQPLRYVVSDIRTGASLAIAYGGQPRVIDGNRPDFARTFPREVQLACGFATVAVRPGPRDRSAPRYDPLDDVLAEAGPLQPVTLQLADGTVRTYFVGVRQPVRDANCIVPG